MSLDDESTTTQPEQKYQLRSNTDHLSRFFWTHDFTTIPPSVYNATIIEYNSYQEFRFKLHYMNNTLESIWRG
jgi:hypothetical protein